MEPRTTRAVTDLASLRAVVGPDAPDAVLSALLEESGSVQEAAAAYLDQSTTAKPRKEKKAAAAASSSSAPWACEACTFENTAAATVCAMCGARSPHVPAPPPVDTAPLAADLAALAAALRGSALLVGPNEYEPKRGAKGFANLVNGDCMPHALGLGVQYLLGRKVCKDPEHVALGQRVRALLHAHIDEHWRAAPSVSPALKWSEIVTLAHNAAISDDERAVYGEWGADADEQRTRWRAERDDLYCGLPELICFAECLRGVGVDASLRVWRQVDGKLQVVTRVPEPTAEPPSADAPTARVVLDLQLTGQLDSASAHYKLLVAGSLRDGVPKQGAAAQGGNRKRKVGK